MFRTILRRSLLPLGFVVGDLALIENHRFNLHEDDRAKALQGLQKRQATPLISSEAPRLNGVNRTRGLRILVIDGGGSRGVVAATILAKIESELSKQKGGKVFLGDHFDIICGTSVGGIIALAHGHGRIELEGIRDVLESGIIFQRKYGIVSNLWALLFEGGLYSEYPVQELLTEVFPPRFTKGKHEIRRLDDGKQGRILRMQERDGDASSKRPRLVVVSNPANTTRTMLFTNYPFDEYTRETTLDIGFPYPSSSKINAAQAARATSAAPTIFPGASVSVNPFETLLLDAQPENDAPSRNPATQFWDGGLINNSPVQIAISEAQMLFGARTGIDLVVSVGCGIDRKRPGNLEVDFDWASATFLSRLCQKLQDPLYSVFRMLRTLKDAITNSENEYTSAVRSLSVFPEFQSLTRERMFRLNPLMDLHVSLNESNPSLLRAAAREVEAQLVDVESQLNIKVERIVRLLQESDLIQQSATGLLDHRAKALDAMKGLPPALISWDVDILKRHRLLQGLTTSSSEENDARYLYPFRLTKWQHRFDTLALPLIDYLNAVQVDLTPAEWGCQRANNTALAAEIENARASLARNFLYSFVKHAKANNGGKLTTKILLDFGIDRIDQLLRVLLPFEFANSMLVMRLKPESKRGWVWITKKDWEEHPEKTRAELWPKNRDYTINESFVDIYKALCQDDRVRREHASLIKFIEGFLKPKAPKWMKEAYPSSFAGMDCGEM